MAKSPRNQFLAFEKEVDAALAGLPIAALPARTVLTYLLTSIFYFLHVDAKTYWKAGDTLTYRVSYLLPWLLGRNPGSPDGGPAARMKEFRDADPTGADAKNLVSYAHFCEITPDVHRRRLDVELIPNGYRLVHPSAEFALAEATDIIVSELALNHFAHTKKRLPDREIFALARTAPRLDDTLLARVLKRREAFYRARVREAPLVDDAAMIEVFGFGRHRFSQIQAAIFAIADVFIQLATALWAKSTGYGQTPSEEAVEWAVPCWTYEGFLEKIAGLCDASRAEIERFVERFTFDFKLPFEEMRGGEGFTPPFFRLENAILFSPDLIMRYLHPRNALAAMIRTDLDLFNNLISDRLEPTLLDEIASAFERFRTTIVRKNIDFGSGEFDLVVADSEGLHVLIFEVKAPLPPQGSRPTQRLAERIDEGLEQLCRIGSMPAVDRAKILERALGIDVSKAKIRYVIAARSCFGTEKAWDPHAETVPTTLPLIRLALARIREKAGNPARDLPEAIGSVVKAILEDARFHWTHAALPLCGRIVETPQLIFDNDVVDRWMRKASAAGIQLRKPRKV